MKNHIILTIGGVALLSAGCDRKTPVATEPGPQLPAPQPVARTQTFETHALRKAIDGYEYAPSAVQHARVKKAFAEIDGEIAELVEHVAKKDGEEQAEAARKLANLRTYRDAEQVRFLRAEARAPVTGAPARPVASDGTAERVGEKIDDAARKAEDKLREAADAIRDKVK